MGEDKTFYFVRTKGEQVAVGFYFSTWLELADVVDETCPPETCEAAEIDFSCGIAISGRPVFTITNDDGDFLDPEGAVANSDDWCMTERLTSALCWPHIFNDDLEFRDVGE